MKDGKWSWWAKKPWNGKAKVREDAKQYYEKIYQAFARYALPFPLLAVLCNPPCPLHQLNGASQ